MWPQDQSSQQDLGMCLSGDAHSAKKNNASGSRRWRTLWVLLSLNTFPLLVHEISGKDHTFEAPQTSRDYQKNIVGCCRGQLSFPSPLGTCEPFPRGRGLGRAWSPTAAKRSNIASPSPWIQRSRLLGQACPIRYSWSLEGSSLEKVTKGRGVS